MKSLLRSPFAGLILTGMTASTALLLETRLSVSQDVHFLLELLWLGVISAALLTFALATALRPAIPPPDAGEDDPLPSTTAELLPEFLDEDRLWLQAHPDASSNLQI